MTAIVCTTAVLMASGCSGDSAVEAYEQLGFDASAAEVVAKSVLDADVRTRLGEHADVAIAIQLVPDGYSWADALCAVEAAKTVMGEAYDDLTVGTIRSIVWDYPEIRDAATACQSPETIARRTNTVEQDGVAIEQPLPGEDPDLDAVTGYLDWLFTTNAKRAGLQSDDVECIFDETIGGLTPTTAAGLLDRSVKLSIGDVATALETCLDEGEVYEAAVLAAPSIAASTEAAEAEATRVKLLQDAWAATSTTAPPQG